jgi:hypothetical protein
VVILAGSGRLAIYARPVGAEDTDVAFRLRAFPVAVFADLLRESGGALNARALKQLLANRGVDRAAVDAAWKRAQPGLRRHGHVEVGPPGVYRWRAGPPVEALTPDAALDRLAAQRLTATGRAELVDVVRAALLERDALEERARGAYRDAVQLRTAHERQLRIDAARALAEVAMEVEELAAAGADARVAVERIRALVAGFGLVPIGRAGERTLFDVAAHTPIGVGVPAGSDVLIIRPGYTWQAGDQDVLLARAQVAPV